jgi:predicted Zn-dependent protease
MLEFFKKLQNEEYRYGYSRQNVDPYAQTHPMSADRIATLTADLHASPAWNAQTPAALDERFKRIRAKLKGYVQDPKRTLNDFPEDDHSIYAHYARAYAWHKAAYPDKAEAECQALLKADPNDPYFLEVQGQVLLESGQPKEAVAPLRRAVALTRNQPLIATTFGHALIATEDKANYPEALTVLRAATARDDQDPFAWYELGTVYAAMGDEAHAALATAEQASINHQDGVAAFHARAAMAGLSPNTPDWLRAQDIAMVSGSDSGNRRQRR